MSKNTEIYGLSCVPWVLFTMVHRNRNTTTTTVASTHLTPHVLPCLACPLMSSLGAFIILFFPPPIHYIRPFFSLLPIDSRDSDPGSHRQQALLPPPQQYGSCFHFYLEKASALSSLVDSHTLATGKKNFFCCST